MIPDFAGYLLIRNGLAAMAVYSRRFDRARPWATAMAIYTGALYLLDLSGLAAQLGTAVTLPLGLLSIAGSLKVTYEIIRGVAEMETAAGVVLNAESLRLFWLWMAFAAYGSILLFRIFPAFALASILFGLIANIAFLFSFHKAKTLFETHREHIPFTRDG